MTAGPGSPLPSRAAAVIAECALLIDGFGRAGRRLYLVGGLVRDLYDGTALDDLDLDFTTDADPRSVRAILEPIADALWTQGERFGTIAATIDGRLVEITTHRAEAYDPETRKPSVVFSDDVLVDLSRRDFTINALAIELTSAEPQLIDPFDGLGDLRARRLRTPLAPAESFSDDPLRMLRAARFAARLGVVPDPDVVVAIAAMVERLSVVSRERIRVEVEKLLSVADPTPGLRLLVDTGLARSFLPELDETSMAVISAVRADPVLRLAAVLLGSGDAVARRRLRDLKCSRAEIARVGALVAAASTILAHTGAWSDADLRRLAARAGSDLDDVVMVASVAEPSGGRSLSAALAAFREREDLADLGVPVDGRQIMERLGLDAGPGIGAALDHLRDLRLEHGPMSVSDAWEHLDAWMGERN